MTESNTEYAARELEDLDWLDTAVLKGCAKELRRLEAENEMLRKDAAMLDWLEQNKQSLYTCTHEERVPRTTTEPGFYRRLVFDGWACGMQEEAFKTPRAAINAALAAKPEGERA